MVIFLLLAAAAQLPPAPPPMMRAVTAPPAPRIYVPTIASPPLDNGPRRRIGIILRAGDATLWNGSLLVSARGGASWRQSKQEAAAETCVTGRAYDQSQNELSVTLSPNYVGSDPITPTIVVTVRWVRPGEGRCGGSRTVEVRETVALGAGKAQLLRADGGLSVEVREM